MKASFEIGPTVPLVQPLLVAVTVKAGDKIDSLSARMAFPDYQRERFVTLNGLDPDQALVPGRLVKLVVNG